MPVFEDIEVTVSTSIDFEVFCGTCGAGLCDQSDTRHSRSRVHAQVTVKVCEDCLETARQEIREDLENQIEGLQEELRELKEKLNNV
jgi:NMD protein affecting ribosome stability and mRNA decay